MSLLANAVRQGILQANATVADLDAIDLLINCQLAWHFYKEQHPAANRDDFIINYYTARFPRMTKDAMDSAASILRWKGHTLTIKHPVTQKPWKVNRVCYAFDLQFAFSVGVDYASPDAIPFPKELIEENKRKLNS